MFSALAHGAEPFDTVCVPDYKNKSIESRIGAELRTGYLFSSKGFSGYADAPDKKNLHTTTSFDLTYGFRFTGSTPLGRLYPKAYQGVGAALTTFYGGSSIGTPVSIYLFQGAPLKTINERFSIDYEWKFGPSFGWHKFSDEMGMEANVIVGSRVNALINFSLMANCKVSDRTRVKFGIEATHFSNGNTAIPNPGVNSIGLKLGIVYTPSPAKEEKIECGENEEIRPHLSYDLLAYGASRKQLVNLSDNQRLAAPGSFPVVGLSFAPMYVVNKYFRAGVSADLKYDGASNLQKYIDEDSTEDDIKYARQPFNQGLMAGLSARVELVMPIFSINAGVGRNIAGVKAIRKFYQTLNLKIHFTQRAWINVGYQLHSFHTPENLVIGLGYTFH